MIIGLSGAVFAQDTKQHERPDVLPPATAAEHVRKVEAGTVYYARGLARSGLKRDDLVDVTVFPSTGQVDPPSKD